MKWLHRIVSISFSSSTSLISLMISEQIVGPKSTTEPQAGLYTTARAGPLARLISKAINSSPKADPDNLTLYNSRSPPAALHCLQPSDGFVQLRAPLPVKLANRRKTRNATSTRTITTAFASYSLSLI